VRNSTRFCSPASGANLSVNDRVFNFPISAYWEARLRQGNRCASCKDDLGDATRREAPGHHSGITRQEAKALNMQNNPGWIRSSENCAVLCTTCHNEFAHNGGHFQTAIENTNDYAFFEDDPSSSRLLSVKQEIAHENAVAAYTTISPYPLNLPHGTINMPSFEDRKKDPTQDNLFGADAGPKAEQGSARISSGGQGGNNGEKNNQSLDTNSLPRGNWREQAAKDIAHNVEQKPLSRWEFPENQQTKESTSYADFINSHDKKHETKNEQSQQQKQEEIKKQDYEHKY
jgi:hypothetical protein